MIIHDAKIPIRSMLTPTSIQVFVELAVKIPNRDKILKLGMRNFKVSGGQAIFQVAIIFVMANIAMTV